MSFAEKYTALLRSQPEFYIGKLASLWASEVSSDRRNQGSPMSIQEGDEVQEKFLNQIKTAIESRGLRATWYEKGHNWIVKTQDYIEWAKLNDAGPRFFSRMWQT